MSYKRKPYVKAGYHLNWDVFIHMKPGFKHRFVFFPWRTLTNVDYSLIYIIDQYLDYELFGMLSYLYEPYGHTYAIRDRYFYDFCQLESADSVQYLLSGVNLNVSNEHHLFVCMFSGALVQNNVSVMKYLNEHLCYQNTFDNLMIENFFIPFKKACMRSYYEAVEYCLQTMQEPLWKKYIMLHMSKKLFHNVCTTGDVKMVKLLIHHGACVKRKKYAIIAAAARSGSLELVQYLESLSKNRYSKSYQHVANACLSGNLDLFKYFKRRLNISVDIQTVMEWQNNLPFEYAIASNNVELVKYMLANGFNFYKMYPNGVPLNIVCESKMIKMFQFIISLVLHKSDIDWESLLFKTCVHKDINMLAYLLEYIDKHRIQFDYNRIIVDLLTSASVNDCPLVYELFIQRGHDMTPIAVEIFHTACRDYAVNCMWYMFDYITEHKIQTSENLIYNCIFPSTSYINLRVIKTFVDMGFDISPYIQKLMYTAFHDKYIACMDYLISIGADVQQNDNQMLRYAYKHNQFFMKAYLLSKGAKIDECQELSQFTNTSR